MTYNPREIVRDGPFTAPRQWHHALKVLVAVSLYAAFRDGLHFAPWLAAMLASPVYIALLTSKEWSWPSDPAEHTYSRWLRVSDFATDFSLTLPAIVLACTAAGLWLLAIAVAAAGAALYLIFRHNARP